VALRCLSRVASLTITPKGIAIPRWRDRWVMRLDARGHFEEPHTNRRIGCGTIEVGNYLARLFIMICFPAS
jgi:hypothetical protein